MEIEKKARETDNSYHVHILILLTNFKCLELIKITEFRLKIVLIDKRRTTCRHSLTHQLLRTQ